MKSHNLNIDSSDENLEPQELIANIKQQLANKALSFLAKREYSQYELQQKLLRYCDDELLINELLLSLKEQNLQSNERFAELYVRSHTHRGKGPNWIRHQLMQHQISECLIEDQLNNPDIDWDSITRTVLAKKANLGDLKQLEYSQKAKLFNFMQQRGFPIEWINNAFKS